MDQLISILTELAGIVVTIFGYHAVIRVLRPDIQALERAMTAMRAEMRDLEERMKSALANKIDVTEYRAKTAELHTKINALELSLAVLRERAK